MRARRRASVQPHEPRGGRAVALDRTRVAFWARLIDALRRSALVTEALSTCEAALESLPDEPGLLTRLQLVRPAPVLDDLAGSIAADRVALGFDEIIAISSRIENDEHRADLARRLARS